MLHSLSLAFLFLLITASSAALANAALLAENSSAQPSCKTPPCYTNQLIHQHSPYLLQHAHNPINWMPWSDAAFTLAKKENKPIFLSIGYSACHWCHVMEAESFNNEQIAAIVNKHYIAIKVDREQYPDIDEFYANAVMHFQGVQGWPMSLFLTPDGKAFYGGGYYTPEQLESLLITQKDRWKNRHADVIKTSQALLQKSQTTTSTTQQAMRLDDSIRMQAIKELLDTQDIDYGGFGESSKFPREYWLWLLLEQSRELPTSDPAFYALHNTLTHMARGGLHDHLAGGFFRYTTDQFWRVPHFEKMLYSQALLSLLYLQTASIQPNTEYQQVAAKTLNFMLHNLRAPDGGFYASLDADTVDGEGYYYIWTLDQINAALTKEEATLAADYYQINKHGEMDDGGNILYTDLSLSTTPRTITSINKKLLAVRSRRTAPAIDKKIIMSWNSMAIIALTEGADNLNNPAYLKQAQDTANFIWNKMQSEQGFYRIFINGQRDLPAQLEDYAWYLSALIKLYDSDENPLWLQRAKNIANTIDVEFTDKDQSGLFQTAKSLTNYLPVRPKSSADKTLPSAAAIASQAMIRLARRTGNQRYRLIAENIFASFAADAVANPLAHATLLLASREYLQQPNHLPMYAARGNIRVHAQLSVLTDNTYKLRIEIKMQNNWHINAHQPLDKKLIGTQLRTAKSSGWTLLDTQYPQPKLLTLGFSDEPLALYADTVEIHATVNKDKTDRNPLLQLKLQACNDQLCLPEELLQFSPVAQMGVRAQY